MHAQVPKTHPDLHFDHLGYQKFFLDDDGYPLFAQKLSVSLKDCQSSAQSLSLSTGTSPAGTSFASATTATLGGKQRGQPNDRMLRT